MCSLRRSRSWGAIALIAALGCRSDRTDGDRPQDTGERSASSCDASTDTVEVTDLAVTLNPNNALSAYVRWSTTPAAGATLRVVCGDDYDVSTTIEIDRVAHEVFVLGLVEGQPCTAEVFALTSCGQTGRESARFAPGPLPDELPDLRVSGSTTGNFRSGWTLFNLNNAFDGVPLLVAAVDRNGVYRWYHRRDHPKPGGDNDVRVIPDGVLVGGSADQPPVIVDWQSRVVWTGDFSMHHHIEEDSDGKLLYIDDTPGGCADAIASSSIYRFDRSSARVEWQWRLCEHFSPRFPRPDWAHANSVSVFADQRAMLLSARNLNALFKIDLATEEILWQLGGGGDFSFGPDAEFLMQHDPEIQDDGNILLFDNGRTNRREYSRAIELALDESARRATLVWEFRATPDLFTPIWGDADRLDNENTLVTFGHRSQVQDSHLIEVTPAGSEVWHLVSPPSWGIYRAERIDLPTLMFALDD